MATLDIDAVHRYRLVAEVCRRLGVSRTDTVLDVGGGTGRLTQYLETEKVFTLDPFGEGKNHIRASMQRIPLPDSSQDVVVQIDSLEHVPAAIRRESLLELVRVAQRFVIWVGPVDSPLTVEVEEDLCSVHKELFGGREMQWLSEHREHGLPDPDLVIETLSESLADSVSWFSFPLAKWWTLMRLDQQLESGMFQPELEKEIDKWYEESGWKFDYRVGSGIPGYRLVVVGAKQDSLPPGLPDPPSDIHTLGEWKLAIPLIEAIALASPLDRNGRSQDTLVARQLARLEEQLIRQERPEKRSWWKRFFG